MKDLMADILGKDCKTTILNMIKEQRKDVEKAKKTMCE